MPQGIHALGGNTMQCRYATHLDEATANGHTVNTEATSRAVAEQMRELGYTTGKSSVGDHAAGRCACDSDTTVTPSATTGKITPEATKVVRILTLDIETTPNLAYVWGLFKQNISIGQLQEASNVLCWVGKWYGSDEVLFHSDYADGHDAMIEAAYKAINEADIVVHYNGTTFDMPNLHREFLLAGFPPPKPYKQIDLLRTVRKQFRFTSNKLDYVAQQLGLGSKTAHTGFQLWLDCMASDPEAWALMEEYNRQDVHLTENLFDRLRPWIPNMPHLAMFTGDDWSCPHCGHKDVSTNRKGEAYANVQRYRLYQCPNCEAWIRGNTKLLNKTETRVARTC